MSVTKQFNYLVVSWAIPHVKHKRRQDESHTRPNPYFAETQRTLLFGGTPFFYRALLRLFQAPKWKLAPSKKRLVTSNL